jgi:hypothetical protein
MWEKGGIAVLILNLEARRWQIVSFNPAPFYPRGQETPYQSNMKLGGLQKQYGRFGKVKCTLIQALRLCTGLTAHRKSRGIALLFHDHGTRRGCGDSVTLRPLFTSRKGSVPIVQEAGWAPGPV